MSDSPNNHADKDTELTMCDVLEEEQELEEDANAVLGGSDDKNCSYDQGYVSRQALYACTSCSKDGEAGICLACCYACHDGHEVVELYTKRNFRCDCGNSKFGDKKCTLRPNKQPLNSKNKYNQNFKGLYCSCRRPYPDLEDSVPDEMIQCIVCEDWYHGRHLDVKVPEDYYEMICGKCMESHSFLYPYLSLYDVKVDVLSCSPEHNGTDPVVQLKSEQNDSHSAIVCDANNGASTVDSLVKNEATSSIVPNNEAHSCADDTIVKMEDVDAMKEPLGTCALKKIDKSKIVMKGAAFWPENWRKELCGCSACMEMYLQSGCEFLLNLDDTIQAYEERGKKEGSVSQYDKGMSALSQLDRVKQMEAVRAYTSMKGELKEYLKEFANNKRTVQESDIREFFEQMAKKKRLNNGIPHFCR